MLDIRTDTIRNAVRDQWNRLRHDLNKGADIRTMQDMYVAELREAYSATVRFTALAEQIWITIQDNALAQRLSNYAGTLHARTTLLQSILDELDSGERDHPDAVMQALAQKASRAAERHDEGIRDAALAGAIQAVMHYMIAEHGTLAAHARAVGRNTDAEHFAQFAQQDKSMDAEISDMAVCTLNLKASNSHSSNRTVG